ncbi:MAG: bifunctional precorrin-2 dehydrogenase/sirohydrochlorin ferrochelatase [Acidobacteria bacterium]|nr:bifunctional precorrin-2 dehydrogenase/sirohydrochlorin ferrochelatase [Acidobacteriota bacterium]
MRYYPVFLDLKDKPVLVAGAGKVALRKAKGLVEAGARVTVVAPRWEPEFEHLPVRLVKRTVEFSDLEGAYLAFTATDDRAANHAIAGEAKRRGIPVNVADAPPECDFLVPSRIERGDVQIAVSTGGRSPRLAVEVRRKIEEML